MGHGEGCTALVCSPLCHLPALGTQQWVCLHSHGFMSHQQRAKAGNVSPAPCPHPSLQAAFCPFPSMGKGGSVRSVRAGAALWDLCFISAQQSAGLCCCCRRKVCSKLRFGTKALGMALDVVKDPRAGIPASPSSSSALAMLVQLISNARGRGPVSLCYCYCIRWVGWLQPTAPGTSLEGLRLPFRIGARWHSSLPSTWGTSAHSQAGQLSKAPRFPPQVLSDGDLGPAARSALGRR